MLWVGDFLFDDSYDNAINIVIDLAKDLIIHFTKAEPLINQNIAAAMERWEAGPHIGPEPSAPPRPAGDGHF